jgi:hypothetical protein
MTDPCTKEEDIGMFKEFMHNYKGVRTVLAGVVVAIILQVGTFLYLWGGLTNTVAKNSDYIWGEMTLSTRENTRNLDRLMAKLETIKIIAVMDNNTIK